MATRSHVKVPFNQWKFSWLALIIAILCLIAATLFTYPYAAQWVTQYNQSNVIIDQEAADRLSGKIYAQEKLAAAREYNNKLHAEGIFRSGDNIMTGTGTGQESAQYEDLLNNDPNHVMARLRVPTINLDLPVYHGTSDETLLKGVGHLKGTSLPVGGIGTRTVLTGHRGLATAELFTNLNKVKENDTFSIEVMGEVFSYRVFQVQVVAPDATEEIRAIPGKDLATLVTCTPLGINTHRILITGERIIPTPQSDLDAAGEIPSTPSFPWWIVIYLTAVLLISLWYWRSGYAPARPPKKPKRH